MQRALRLELIIALHRFSISLNTTLCNWFLAQIYAQKDQMFLWLPILLSVGIGVYFLLPFEPPLALCLILWVLSLSLHAFSKGVIRYFFFTLILIQSGFFVSAIRTHSVHTAVIDKPIKFTDLSGRVLSVEPLEEGGGSRIVLSNLEIEKLSPDLTPRKVRLRLRQDTLVAVGQKIQVLASLQPPSSPVIPGGFDFRRYMYFQGIGAVGFIYKEPVILSGYQHRFGIIERIRSHLSKTIQNNLKPEQASIALALIVGQKNAIAENDRQALRDSGLAHMLAISGLHVGLVSGTLFFLFRFFLAAFPSIALNYQIKKIAAVFAFMGAVFYMLIAGMTVPTQRAVLMIGVVFLAILLDRSPISLRLVAFSAVIVLLFSPESVLSASFHMSFAAVTCLVYFYDRTREFWSRHYTQSNWSKKALLYFLTVCLTTVIASIATAPFALYHFGQVSFVGSVANLIAVPLFAFVIMPFALFSTFCAIFGLEFLPLQFVGGGIELLMETAYWASDLPHAIYKTTAWSFQAFVLLVCSGLWIILWKGYGKILFLLPLFLSFSIAVHVKLPDLLISSSHKLFAFHHDDQMYVSTKSSDKFVRERWQDYYAVDDKDIIRLNFKGHKTDLYSDYFCGEEGCRFERNNQKISYIISPYAHKKECDWADILISARPVEKGTCRSPHIVDKFDTWGAGAHAVFIGDDAVTIETVTDYIGTRPWSQYTKRQN